MPIKNNFYIQRCTSYHPTYRVLRDGEEENKYPIAAWESFNEHSLPLYLKKGVESIQLELAAVANISQPYTPAQAQRFAFMAESLAYARMLIEDTDSTT